MRLAALILVLLVGCGQELPPVNAAEVQRNVDTLTSTVNAAAIDIAKTRGDIELVCAVSADACAVLEALYAGADRGVDHAHDMVAIYGEFGRGLAPARAAVDAIERAALMLRDKVKEVADELGKAVGSDSGRGSVAAEQPEGETEAGSDAEDAADGERSGADGASPPAEGQREPEERTDSGSEATQ